MNNPKHVLVIEDNDMDIYIVDNALRKSNAAKVITVKKSAEEALDFLQHQAYEMGLFPDFIFLDLNMPGMSGFDFLREYEKFPLSIKEKTDIVVTTSSDDSLDREKARRNPWVKQYIVKPVTIKIVDSIC